MLGHDSGSASTRRLAINWLGGLGALSTIGIVILALLGQSEARFLGYGLVAAVSALAALTPRSEGAPSAMLPPSTTMPPRV